MGEKRKWFGKRPVRLPEPILGVSNVSVEEAAELMRSVSTAKLYDRAGRTFQPLVAMPPATRLAKNLQTLLSLLAEASVSSVIPDGLTRRELEALIALQTHDFSPRLREIAQGLLNVNERYMLLAAVKKMFRDERARPWEVGVGRL